MEINVPLYIGTININIRPYVIILYQYRSMKTTLLSVWMCWVYPLRWALFIDEYNRIVADLLKYDPRGVITKGL